MPSFLMSYSSGSDHFGSSTMPPARADLGGPVAHRGFVLLLEEHGAQFLVHLLTGDRVRLPPARRILRFAPNGAAYLCAADGGQQQWVYPLLAHSLHEDHHGHYWRLHRTTGDITKSSRFGMVSTFYPEIPVRAGQVTALKVYLVKPNFEGCHLWFEMCYVQHILEHTSPFAKGAQWLPSRYREWRKTLAGYGLGPGHLQQPWQPSHARTLPPQSVLLRFPKRSASSLAVIWILVRFVLHAHDEKLKNSAADLLRGLMLTFCRPRMTLASSRPPAEATAELESMVLLNTGQVCLGGRAWRSATSPWRQFRTACAAEGWEADSLVDLLLVLRVASRIRRLGRDLLILFVNLVVHSMEAGFADRRCRENPVAANALLPKHSVEDQAIYDLAVRSEEKEEKKKNKGCSISVHGSWHFSYYSN